MKLGQTTFPAHKYIQQPRSSQGSVLSGLLWRLHRIDIINLNSIASFLPFWRRVVRLKVSSFEDDLVFRVTNPHPESHQESPIGTKEFQGSKEFWVRNWGQRPNISRNQRQSPTFYTYHVNFPKLEANSIWPIQGLALNSHI